MRCLPRQRKPGTCATTRSSWGTRANEAGVATQKLSRATNNAGGAFYRRLRRSGLGDHIWIFRLERPVFGCRPRMPPSQQLAEVGTLNHRVERQRQASGAAPRFFGDAPPANRGHRTNFNRLDASPLNRTVREMKLYSLVVALTLMPVVALAQTFSWQNYVVPETGAVAQIPTTVFL